MRSSNLGICKASRSRSSDLSKTGHSIKVEKLNLGLSALQLSVQDNTRHGPTRNVTTCFEDTIEISAVFGSIIPDPFLSVYIMKWSYILITNVPQWEVNVKLMKKKCQTIIKRLTSVASCFEMVFLQ